MTCLSTSLSPAASPNGDRTSLPHGDLTPQPTLAEVFPATVVDGAAAGFVIGHLPVLGTRPVLWVQDRVSLRESGRPYLAGMAHPPDMLCLTVSKAVDVLWAMEQALCCAALGAVVGEVWGDPAALDFTATKRLALRAETHGVPAWLIRRAGTADLSAARERWRLSSLPSLPDPDDRRAPGAPQWRADLFRARWRTPGDWVVRHDGPGLAFVHEVAADADADAAARVALR